MKVFLENREKVAEHNARFAKGEETFTLAMNKFGDLLTHEFAALYNGYNSEKHARKGGVTFVKPENFQAPASVDWRQSDTLLPSRTRNNADPAGLSQLSVLWKDKTSVKLVNWSPRGPSKAPTAE